MFKQHPNGLYLLFTTEMWERFSYYGMRAILSLYMLQALFYNTAFSSSIYGYYTGMVYLTPLIGGYIADRYWGNRKSIIFGGLLMALGQFSLAISGYLYTPQPGVINTFFVFNNQTIFFLVGLFLLVLGNGFFKPNISTMVGFLYSDNDGRRDSAFTIFYMGINLGALISPLIIGLVTGNNPAYYMYGFLAAGIGMLLGLATFILGKDKYLVNPKGDAVGVIPNHKDIPCDIGDQTLTWVEKQRIIVIVILAFFGIFFWMAFEQAGVSLTFLAEQHVDRVITALNFKIPTPWFQSVNPLAILIFAPFFAGLWLKLKNKGKEPSIPLKMAGGLLLLSIGFMILVIASKTLDTGANISPLWLIAAYILFTFGELCISPIGLSMVSKLSPARFTCLLMGIWFLTNAFANVLAGFLSTLYPDPSQPTAYILGIPIDNFTAFFMVFVILSLIAVIALFIMRGKLETMMHGIE
ncbi:MAG: peptide MFS transporter [Methanobacterium sp.]|nr:peptide MFS transporter [Methanobacterium sp.]